MGSKIMTEEQIKELKRKYQSDHKRLAELSKSCFIYLRRLDDVMKNCKDDQLGRIIAEMANYLEMANDQARYFNLGVNYRKDDKDKEWQKIKNSHH